MPKPTPAQGDLLYRRGDWWPAPKTRAEAELRIQGRKNSVMGGNYTRGFLGWMVFDKVRRYGDARPGQTDSSTPEHEYWRSRRSGRPV